MSVTSLASSEDTLDEAVDQNDLTASSSKGPASRWVARAAGAVRSRTLRVVIRRLLSAIPLLLVVSFLSFLLLSLTPGDSAQSILGGEGSPAALAKLKSQLGLDHSLLHQYGSWLHGALAGDFGNSVFSHQPVFDLVMSRLPVTVTLVVASLLVLVTVGVSLGVFSAVRGGIPAKVVDSLSLVAFAMPSFWIGAILVALFAVKLGWLPATGYVSFADSPSQWMKSLVLPVTALSLHGIAAIAKQTREAMLEVLDSEHVRMARANGMRVRSIVFRHALKNAGIRVVTVLGIQVVGLLTGTVVVETVFGLPGLGSLAVNSTLQLDIPVVQGVVVCFTILVVLVNLAVDVAYTRLNPKVRV